MSTETSIPTVDAGHVDISFTDMWQDASGNDTNGPDAVCIDAPGPIFIDVKHAPATALAILTAAGVTPDLITIDRADLPEVTVKDVYGREYLVVDGSTYANELSADEWKKSAVRRYALAEFLEAREKAAEDAAAAEKEAAAKLTKRRDELARELSPEASRANNHQSYDGQSLIGQRAIDRIIELESDRG